METSRRVLVPGTFNFRDVGGFAASGGTVKHGVLYRSDGLQNLGDAGREKLIDLGVGVVIDLRDEPEAHAMPDDIEGLGLEVLRLPVFEGSGASQGAGISLADLYARIITQHSAVVIDALREIDDSHGRATVVHCTAGKDRTGVVVALALLAVGVDRDDVLDDYAVTQSNLAGEWLEGMVALIGTYGVADTPELRTLMGGSPREALASALDLIDREYGSVREYLLASGFTLSELTALEDVLVDKSA